MERYLYHLIEDMREAAQRVPPPGEIWDSIDMNDPGEIEDIAHVERFIYGEEKPLSEIVGIESVQLPPVGKFTQKQVEKLYHEMEQMLKAWHFVPEFPEGLPVKIKYRLLREKWDEKQVFVGAGEVHLEFCNYEPSNCPFPEEFCSCKKWQEEEEDEDNRRRKTDWDEGPFPF